MRALLLFPDRDVDGSQGVPPPWWAAAAQDLSIDTLLSAMTDGDPYLLRVGQQTMMTGCDNDLETIQYRQGVMQDCLRHPDLTRTLYLLAADAMEKRRKGPFYGLLSRQPRSVLAGSVDVLEMLLGMLRRLRGIVDEHTDAFASPGLRHLFAMLRHELRDEYLTSVQDHLARLKFRHGVLLSADLGDQAQGTNYVLRREAARAPNWLQRMLGRTGHAHTIHVHERDEAGARALSALEDRGMTQVADVAQRSAQHILNFLAMLRTELAFYVCGLNLHDHLAAMGVPATMPQAQPAGSRILHFRDLIDVSLSLRLGQKVVANSVEADGALAVIITGANEGGKSTFIRSIGLAQLMMQCGLFVGAASFAGELSDGLFTHFPREEDATVNRGKLDEELERMSAIVDAVGPHATLLLNESLAATNEREGSAIASQVISALLESGVRIFFVTHLYDFARLQADRRRQDVVFLRAERLPDGRRTFKIMPGEPLETSYGPELYAEVFQRHERAISPPALPRRIPNSASAR